MIIGAGLAGLITAHIIPGPILEAAAAPAAAHKALLRFRTEDVSRVTGIDFKPVTVRKGIWHQDGFVKPNIQLANSYSAKCLDGRLANDRSIWNIKPVTRFIAPENFYDQLIDAMRSRITWNEPFDFASCGAQSVISTAPLDLVLRLLKIEHDETFGKAPIIVKRYRVDACDLYQTVYFPSHATPIYRASITKDLLIVEARAEFEFSDVEFAAFGLCQTRVDVIDSSGQRYGKISAINELSRKYFISKLSTDHNIFSVGRFATWRNILLDDVAKDANVVKRLLAASVYERKLHQHK